MSFLNVLNIHSLWEKLINCTHFIEYIIQNKPMVKKIWFFSVWGYIAHVLLSDASNWKQFFIILIIDTIVTYIFWIRSEIKKRDILQ